MPSETLCQESRIMRWSGAYRDQLCTGRQVSPRNKQKPRSANSLDGLWKLARKQAGIEDVRLYDFRYSVASQAVLKGVPLPVVARLPGHSQVSMMLRYAHVVEREVEAAAENVCDLNTGKLCVSRSQRL